MNINVDTPVGGEAIAKVKPTDLLEAAHVNSLMRLQPTERGGEAPTDKYIRFKNQPQLWLEEMLKAGLNQEEVDIMRKHIGRVFGVAATQEELMRMVMDPEIGNFSLLQANKLRKAVAKANEDAMEEVRIEFFESAKAAGTRIELADYVWNTQSIPQAG